MLQVCSGEVYSALTAGVRLPSHHFLEIYTGIILSISLLTQFRANVLHHSSAVASILKNTTSEPQKLRTLESAKNYAAGLERKIAGLQNKLLKPAAEQEFRVRASFTVVHNSRESSIVSDAREKLSHNASIKNQIADFQSKLSKFQAVLPRG